MGISTRKWSFVRGGGEVQVGVVCVGTIWTEGAWEGTGDTMSIGECDE